MFSKLFFVLVFSLNVFAGKTDITPQEAYNEFTKGKAIIVDVREKDEQEDGVAKGAVLFPFSKIHKETPDWKEFVSKLDKKKTIVFYCASGGRAGRVVDELSKKGFKAKNMGGFEDWQEAKLPTEKR